MHNGRISLIPIFAAINQPFSLATLLLRLRRLQRLRIRRRRRLLCSGVIYRPRPAPQRACAAGLATARRRCPRTTVAPLLLLLLLLLCRLPWLLLRCLLLLLLRLVACLPLIILFQCQLQKVHQLLHRELGVGGLQWAAGCTQQREQSQQAWRGQRPRQAGRCEGGSQVASQQQATARACLHKMHRGEARAH